MRNFRHISFRTNTIVIHIGSSVLFFLIPHISYCHLENRDRYSSPETNGLQRLSIRRSAEVSLSSVPLANARYNNYRKLFAVEAFHEVNYTVGMWFKRILCTF